MASRWVGMVHEARSQITISGAELSPVYEVLVVARDTKASFDTGGIVVIHQPLMPVTDLESGCEHRHTRQARADGLSTMKGIRAVSNLAITPSFNRASSTPSMHREEV